MSAELQQHEQQPSNGCLHFSCSAWEALRAMNKHFGSTQVTEELYQWFAADARTLSYVTAGIHRLLTKPEAEALRIMKNAICRLDKKPAMEWREFVRQNAQDHV